MKARDLYNPLLGWLLRSPFHGLLSRHLLLLTYTGRRTGRRIATPVNYGRHADGLVVFSQSERRWWRNFVGGWPVEVWLHGRPVSGQAHVVATALEAKLDTLRAVYPALSPAQTVRMAPNLVMLFIELAPAGEPQPEERVPA
jgi:hypothetical protein